MLTSVPDRGQETGKQKHELAIPGAPFSFESQTPATPHPTVDPARSYQHAKNALGGRSKQA